MHFGKGWGVVRTCKWPLSTNIDLTKWILKFKRISLKFCRAKYVVPSIWLRELCNQHIGILPTVIRNGVDKNLFSKNTKYKKKTLKVLIQLQISG